MKRLYKTLITGVLFLAIAGMLQFVWVDFASACGYGQGGGQGYVPQRRDSNNPSAQEQALSPEQARDIATGYVKRLNPDLEVGRITDGGSFYEAEIITDGNEVVQLLGVDKQSGRLIVLN
jgi:hypothetical protein